MHLRGSVVAVALLAVTVSGCAQSIAGLPEPVVGQAMSQTAGLAATGGSDLSVPLEPTGSAPSNQNGAPPGSDLSVPGVIPTGLTGLSADCVTVLGATTAFGSLLADGSGGLDGTVSQAAVDSALQQLPASGLPTRPQADVDVLRKTMSAAVGHTVADLAMSIADSTVVDALQDLSSWASTNCD